MKNKLKNIKFNIIRSKFDGIQVEELSTETHRKSGQHSLLVTTCPSKQKKMLTKPTSYLNKFASTTSLTSSLHGTSA